MLRGGGHVIGLLGLLGFLSAAAVLLGPDRAPAQDSEIRTEIRELRERLESLEKKLAEEEAAKEKAVAEHAKSEERLQRIEQAVAEPARPQPTHPQGEKGNLVFFRGGFAGLTSSRAGEAFTDVFGASGQNTATKGYYIGGGLDLLLTKDFWGLAERLPLLQGTWLVGELGVEYKRFGSNNPPTVANAAPTLVNLATQTGGVAKGTVPLAMLTVDIAPKLKFMEGHRLRPWVIPIGLDFHVISPPSNVTSYLDAGVQFGTGLEYRIWKDLKLGVDGRFHLAFDQTQTINNFGTAGAYIGFGF